MYSRERTLVARSLFGITGLFIVFVFIQSVFIRPSVESALEKSAPAALNKKLSAEALPVRIGESVGSGHADSSGDSRKNLELSRLRAEAAGAILQRAGVESGRHALKVFGDSRATADESTEEGRRLNRRVEIKVK